MNILNDEIAKKIEKGIIHPIILQRRYDLAAKAIPKVIDELYANIPDSKRISYGIVHTIKVLGENIYIHLIELDAPVYEIASSIYSRSRDFKSKGVSLGILSFHGLDAHEKVLPYFESAAASSDWNVREFAQMFFRKLIKTYPDEMSEYLLELVKSEDANIRRFVAETLRPVQENWWFYKNPDYPLSILKKCFKSVHLIHVRL